MNRDDFSVDGLRESARQMGVPEHIRDGLILYIRTGMRMGDFCTALVQNDLRGAVMRADPENRLRLREIMLWLHNCTPSQCHGSHEKYTTWHGMGGFEGFEVIRGGNDGRTD